MSSTSQTSNQATAKMNGNNKNYDSSPEAAKNLESPTSATKHTGEQFKDSGFFEDDSVDYKYDGNKDFVLFDEVEDAEYTFDNEEPVDIASTKSIYGSLYNRGKSSLHSSSQYQPSPSSQHDYHYEIQEDAVADEVVYGDEEGEEEEDRPRHRFSSPINNTVEKGFSILEDWSMTFHRHESIAYRFEQPPNPTLVFQDLEQSWNYDNDIDLS